MDVRKTLFFGGFWGFLQLGVVGATPNIVYVTFAVHTFAGKKEFFKSVQYFFFELQTYTHTQTPPKTNMGKMKVWFVF